MPLYDPLFASLAQAKSLPSHALRAVKSAGEAGEDILGGYVAGKDLQQRLQQYKTLNTRLGDIFPPDSIPGGLTPDHTVGQLMQLAPILPYTRSPVADSIANEMSGIPSVPPPTSGSVVPAPTIASTSMAPIPGSANPSPTPGASNLDAIQGAGAENGGNISPGVSPTVTSGASIRTFGGGTSPVPASVPFKGMSYMDLQRYGQFLNDIRQGRQFREGQENENTRAALSRDQSARQFQESQGNERGRAIAGQQDEYTKAINRTMSGFDALNQLASLYDKVPDNQKGAYVGAVTKFGGPMAGKASPDLSTYNQARHAFIGNFAAALDPMGRQNQALLAQVESMTPKVEDDPQVAQNKVQAMHSFLTSTVNRNFQGFDAAAQSIGGHITPATIPPPPRIGASRNATTTRFSGANSNAIPSFDSETQVPPNLPRGTRIRVGGRSAVIR